MKIYGAPICIDCRNFKEIMDERGFEADYIDITESTAKLKAFLALRDREPIFESVRQAGGIGIPFFVRDSGEMTFDMDEALAWIGEPAVRPEEIREHRGCCGPDGC